MAPIQPIHFLVIEDNPRAAPLYEKVPALAPPHRITLIRDGAEGLKRALEQDFDLVLADCAREGDRLRLIEKLHRSKPLLPVILITASHTAEIAIEAVRKALATRARQTAAEARPITGEEEAPAEAQGAAPFRKFVRQILERAAADAGLEAYAHTARAMEAELLGQAIQLSQGNQSLAARWLGISRPTLRTKLNELGLRPRRKEHQDRHATSPRNAAILAGFASPARPVQAFPPKVQ